MPSLQARVEGVLRRMATAPRPNDFLAVGRGQTAGEPIFWQESIAFARGLTQSYSRTRSGADEGGAPIGTWTTAAEEWRVQTLARVLSEVAIWSRESDRDLAPGMEIVNWTCVTDDGVFDLFVASSSPLLQAFMPVDLELRRLANFVEESRQGASLRVVLQVQMSGTHISVQTGFINDGNRPCLIINPFLYEQTDQNFFRLECAAQPEEQPGVTGYGAEFQAQPVEWLPEPVPDPWADEYLLLLPQRLLVLPVSPPVGPFEPGAYMLRAVYSNYRFLDIIAGVPVIRGRVFSNEVEITL